MRAELFARCRPLTEAGSGLTQLSSDAWPLVDAPTAGIFRRLSGDFSGMKQAAEALRVAATRLILSVMSHEKRLRTVERSVAIHQWNSRVIRSSNSEGRGSGGTGLALPVAEGT
jgi:hypothetical protein